MGYRALRAQAEIARYNKHYRSGGYSQQSANESADYFDKPTEDDLSKIQFDTPLNKKWLGVLSLGLIVSLLVMFLGIRPALHGIEEEPLDFVVAVASETPCSLEDIAADVCSPDWSTTGSYCAVDGDNNLDGYTYEESDLLSSVCLRGPNIAELGDSHFYTDSSAFIGVAQFEFNIQVPT